MKESTKRLGEFFARSREAKGLSQREAAARIDCSVTDLSRYENGKTSPTLGRALVMCEVYGKTPNQMAQAMNATVDS
jgi:transcriptional regulator with XRE-family HTH domain